MGAQRLGQEGAGGRGCAAVLACRELRLLPPPRACCQQEQQELCCWWRLTAGRPTGPCHAGNNTYGSLGTDPTGRLSQSGKPVPVWGGKAYSLLAASQWGRFICGLLMDQTVECWGGSRPLALPLHACVFAFEQQGYGAAGEPARLHTGGRS